MRKEEFKESAMNDTPTIVRRDPDTDVRVSIKRIEFVNEGPVSAIKVFYSIHDIEKSALFDPYSGKKVNKTYIHSKHESTFSSESYPELDDMVLTCKAVLEEVVSEQHGIEPEKKDFKPKENLFLQMVGALCTLEDTGNLQDDREEKSQQENPKERDSK